MSGVDNEIISFPCTGMASASEAADEYVLEDAAAMAGVCAPRMFVGRNSNCKACNTCESRNLPLLLLKLI